MASPVSATQYGKFIELQNYEGSPTEKSGSIVLSGSDASEILYTNVGMDVGGYVYSEGLLSGSSLALKGGTSMTAILDEDAMGSNSATALCTQQSIKAYVDAQVSGLDIDSFTDGSGVTIADGDKFLMSDGGTEKYIEASQLATYVYGETAAALTVTGLATFNGSVDLGDATGDTITATGRFDSDLVPSTDSARDLGTSALQWAEAHVDAGYIDALTVTGTSTLTTVDINGGAVDGTIIGANSAAAGTFAALVGTSLNCSDGNITNVGSIALDSIAADDGSSFSFSNDWTNASNTVADLGSVTTCDINGGAIDGTVIGAASVAAGSFAALVGTTATFSSTLAANGDVDLGDATSDTITATGRFDSDLVPSSDSARDLGSSALQWADVHADAGYIDAMTVSGLSALGAVTATTFSGSSTVKCGGDLTVGDDDYGLTTAGALEIASMAANWTNASRTVADMGTVTTMDLNGGSIDGVTIGAASAAAGTFAAMVATSGDFSNGNIGNVGDIDCDTISVADAANGLQVQFGGATTTNKITLEDNLGEALTIEQGGNNYILFETTNDEETIVFGTAGGAVCDFLATGGASGDADFTVAGYAQFAGIVEVDGALDCDSTSNFAGLMTLQAGAAVTGNVTMNGDLTLESDHDAKARSFITYSDSKLKTNVKTVTNAMDMIQGLRGVSYDLKSGGKREFGFIAQEVNTVVPEVVSKNGNLMGIDYTRITSLLVEAVKTQQAQIEALKAKLDK